MENLAQDCGSQWYREGTGLVSSYCFNLARRTTKKDRKSTRLNSSHGYISYAVFCLKKYRRKVLDAMQYIKQCASKLIRQTSGVDIPYKCVATRIGDINIGRCSPTIVTKTSKERTTR